MGEIHKMFEQYDFIISKKDLEELFLVVNDDKEGKTTQKKNNLNLKEFKKCALDEKANQSLNF